MEQERHVSYVVNWDRADGQPGWHRVGELSEATAFVEHLRNVEGLESSRIFALEAVPFEWRPYYKAEVGSTAPAAPTFAATVVAPPPEPVVAPVVEPVVEPVAEPVVQPAWGAALSAVEPAPEPDPDLEPEPANGRRGLFGR
jgi:hypothetical protein